MAYHHKPARPVVARGFAPHRRGIHRLGNGGGVIVAIVILFAIAILGMFTLTRSESRHLRVHANLPASGSGSPIALVRTPS